MSSRSTEYRKLSPGTNNSQSFAMGALFRSDEMALCQLFIQPEAAYPSVSELGETGTVQFRDLNPEVNAFQRKFVNEVRRCDEMERKLRYIEAEMKKDKVNIPEIMNESPRAPNSRDIINLEAQFEKTENEILELSQNAVNLKSNFLELTELKQVLEKTQGFFAEQEGQFNAESMKANLIPEDPNQPQARGKLGFVAGVISRERLPGFERMLWRISRGNVFLRQTELDMTLEDPTTGNPLNKAVFVAFFQGEQLKSRIKKVCTGFHASLYPCPSIHEEREDMLKGVRTRLEDLNMVLNQTQDHRQRVLMSVAKELAVWIVMVRKMKAIYHTLNLFNMDVSRKCLIGECWVPVNDLPVVRKALSDAAAGSTIESFLNLIETSEVPPTFNRTNKFTRGFQNLIDAYGVASYREANPALYTTITFPFLFGIMFGDLGHGMIMGLFGLWMVSFEKSLGAKKSNNEIWNIFFGGRYIILLMGMFSMYTGFVYNDIFSKSMNIFGSSWVINYNTSTVMENPELQLNVRSDDLNSDVIYPIGLDPVWQMGTNKIIFLNSYKMKLSIIFGVVHMIFGVCMSVVNMVHFKHKISILLEFLPQMIFLVLLFLYMVAMMFIKWLIYSPKYTDFAYSPACAPSVLILFINMMLFKNTPPPQGCKEFMFDFQPTINTVFVLIALICVPWMLLGKPFYIMSTRSKKAKANKTNGDINQGMELTPELNEEGKTTVNGEPAATSGGGGGGGHGHEEDEPMSEIFIHQAIHTIEYVLSTISHTASYLRLWALSLAHAQLSEVLWSMVLNIGLTGEGFVGAIMLYIVFGIWAAFTLAILVMMEGLSAFLHTLRLHWVEFMSKFYQGLGYAFEPFCFKTIMDAEDSNPE